MDQRTEEWYQARLGKVTASRIADIIATTKTGWSASRANYEAQLIAERLTGQPQENYINAAMQWGIDYEEEARNAYSFYKDCEVIEVGFIDHAGIKMSGASPDGLIGEHGLLEIKCPTTATHLNFLLTESIPKKYQLQMYWQMACTDRWWCDFVSYDPRLPADLQLKIIRIERNEDFIIELEKDVTEFLCDLQTKLNTIEKLRIAA